MPRSDEGRGSSRPSKPPPWREPDAGEAPARTRDTPVTWEDFGPRTLSFVTWEVMRRCHVSKDHAHDLVADAMARLIRLQACAEHPHRLLITTAVRGLQQELRRRMPEQLDHDLIESGAPHRAWLGSRASHEDSSEVGTRVAEAEATDRRSSRVLQALDRLPPRDRRVLEALYFEKRSVAEIAAASDSTVSAVKIRLFRARERLRAAMARDSAQTFPER